jgi:soluble lytic murein transglycosylase-like protein
MKSPVIKEWVDVLWLVTLFLAAFLLVVLMDAAEARASEPTPEILRVVEDASRRHGVDPRLVLAVMKVESNFNVNAKGAAGEVGLLQLHPRYHLARPGDVTRNVDTGVRYLAYVLRRCRADYGPAAVLCYNHGPFKRLERPLEASYYKKFLKAYNKAAKWSQRAYAQAD